MWSYMFRFCFVYVSMRLYFLCVVLCVLYCFCLCIFLYALHMLFFLMKFSYRYNSACVLSALQAWLQISAPCHDQWCRCPNCFSSTWSWWVQAQAVPIRIKLFRKFRNASPAATAKGRSTPSCAATRPTTTSTAKAATPRALAPRATALDAGPASCNAAMREFESSSILHRISET